MRIRRIKANSALKTNIRIEICEQNTPLFLHFLHMYHRFESTRRPLRQEPLESPRRTPEEILFNIRWLTYFFLDHIDNSATLHVCSSVVFRVRHLNSLALKGITFFDRFSKDISLSVKLQQNYARRRLDQPVC